MSGSAECSGVQLGFLLDVKACVNAWVSPLGRDESVTEGATAGFLYYLLGSKL